jgi:hypothetical protein
VSVLITTEQKEFFFFFFFFAKNVRKSISAPFPRGKKKKNSVGKERGVDHFLELPDLLVVHSLRSCPLPSLKVLSNKDTPHTTLSQFKLPTQKKLSQNMTSDSLPTPPSTSATPAPASAVASGSGSTDASSIAGAAHTTTTTATTTVVGVAGTTGTGAGGGTSTTPPEALEGLLQQILASNSAPALAGTLRITVVTPEEREVILASVTTTGTDPLDALDTTQHTIGILFILCVVLLSPSLYLF